MLFGYQAAHDVTTPITRVEPATLDQLLHPTLAKHIQEQS